MSFDNPSKNSRTLSRTHPPAMRHEVCTPFSARFLVQSSKRLQSCDSTSVRRMSRRSGMGIELRSMRECLNETERDMARMCGLATRSIRCVTRQPELIELVKKHKRLSHFHCHGRQSETCRSTGYRVGTHCVPQEASHKFSKTACSMLISALRSPYATCQMSLAEMLGAQSSLMPILPMPEG